MSTCGSYVQLTKVNLSIPMQ